MQHNRLARVAPDDLRVAMPIVIDVPGAGYFSYTMFEGDMWVTNIMASRKGSGNRVLRAMREYAAAQNKTIYGSLNPIEGGLSVERLKKWYVIQGAEVNEHNVVKY